MIKRILRGHISPETAYIIADYPYGRKLRCKKRVWIETATKGKGVNQMRSMEQTTNPKVTDQEYWNAPKASTYSGFRLMYLDEKDYVQHDGISIYPWQEHMSDFIKKYWHFLIEEEKDKLLALWKDSCRLNKNYQLEMFTKMVEASVVSPAT